MTIYCDGGSRGNPGPAASAFVATSGTDVIHKASKYLGIETNNVAEYEAVLLAVNWLGKQTKKLLITINLDSQLVERHLNEKYKIKNEKLKLLATKIREVITKNNLEINFVWNFRTKNTLADDLVNEELDRHKS